MSHRNTLVAHCRRYLVGELRKVETAAEFADTDDDMDRVKRRLAELGELQDWLRGQTTAGTEPTKAVLEHRLDMLREAPATPAPAPAKSPPAKTSAKSSDMALAGYAARYYDASDPGTVVDWGGGLFERIRRGAFDRVLATQREDIKSVWCHRLDTVFGSRQAGTLKLSTDAKGLRFHVRPPAHHAGYIETVRRGDVGQCSFAFTLGEDDVTFTRTRDGVVAEIIGFERLFEVTVCPFGAFSATNAVAVDQAAERAKLALWKAQLAEQERTQRDLRRLVDMSV